MKKLIFIIMLCIPSLAVAQDVVENVKPLDWRDFQTTQEQLVDQQLKILDTLKEIRETNRQLNINLLSWQTAKQDIMQAVGNTGCDFWKMDKDRKTELVIMGLAAWGVVLTILGIMNFLKKKPKVAE